MWKKEDISEAVENHRCTNRQHLIIRS